MRLSGLFELRGIVLGRVVGVTRVALLFATLTAGELLEPLLLLGALPASLLE
jgi:hypothetical protein